MSMPSKRSMISRVVGDLEIGHDLASPKRCDLHVAAVVRADGHAGVDDAAGSVSMILWIFAVQLGLLLLKLGQTVGVAP